MKLRAILLPALALAGALQAQVPTRGPKLRIGVLDLSGSALTMQTAQTPTATTTTIAIPPPADFARGLSEMLTTALLETGRFVVLERKVIQQVIQEQDFGASGRVNLETAPKVGVAIGAQVLITGDITEYAYQRSALGGNISVLKRVTASAERVTAMVALDLRLIDAVTGAVVSAKRGEGSASATGVAAELTRGDQQIGTQASWTTPLGRASREAIESVVRDIVEDLRAVPWSGRVVDVREGKIYVNAGSEAGVAAGLELDVFAQAAALVDPESGLRLGAPERKIGRIRIVEVEEKYAVAQPVSGGPFERNHLLRLAGSAARP